MANRAAMAMTLGSPPPTSNVVTVAALVAHPGHSVANSAISTRISAHGFEARLQRTIAVCPVASVQCLISMLMKNWTRIPTIAAHRNTSRPLRRCTGTGCTRRWRSRRRSGSRSARPASEARWVPAGPGLSLLPAGGAVVVTASGGGVVLVVVTSILPLALVPAEAAPARRAVAAAPRAAPASWPHRSRCMPRAAPQPRRRSPTIAAGGNQCRSSPEESASYSTPKLRSVSSSGSSRSVRAARSSSSLRGSAAGAGRVRASARAAEGVAGVEGHVLQLPEPRLGATGETRHGHGQPQAPAGIADRAAPAAGRRAPPDPGCRGCAARGQSDRRAPPRRSSRRAATAQRGRWRGCRPRRDGPARARRNSEPAVTPGLAAAEQHRGLVRRRDRRQVGPAGPAPS